MAPQSLSPIIIVMFLVLLTKQSYSVDVTLTWDFESGMLEPHWRMLSHGVYSDRGFGSVQDPDFGVVDLLCLNGTCADGATLNEAGRSGHTCPCLALPEEQQDKCKDNRNPTWAAPYMYLDCRPHAWPNSKYFLSSAIPWGQRDKPHQDLLVRSYPFILGAGDITFWMFGGCFDDCDDPAGYRLRKGTGPIGNVTGVALRTTADNTRRAVATADNEHEWQQDTWRAEDLAPYVGKEVTIDIHDTRHGAWGWLSVDDFQVPVQYYKGPDEYLEALVTETKELGAKAAALEAAKGELVQTEGKLENIEEENHEISVDLAACRAQASEKDAGSTVSSGEYQNAVGAAVFGWLLVAAILIAGLVLWMKYGRRFHTGELQLSETPWTGPRSRQLKNALFNNALFAPFTARSSHRVLDDEHDLYTSLSAGEEVLQ